MSAPDAGAPSGRRSRARPTLVAAAAAGVVIALLVVVLATRSPAGDRIASADLVGMAAPAVSGDVVLGDQFDLGASDRWVVVNFFATWCVPCIQEHPELDAFAAQHDATGAARVISVVYDEEAEVVARFFERNGGDWTVLDADDGRTAFEWGVAKVPESYLVSPNGVVAARFIGGVTQEGLNQAMGWTDGAAAGEPPVPGEAGS
ncbi:hypothetical protein BH23ACT2_BH23ACT2_00540 [soil metagenome]